jgi:peroxiredoxin
MTQLAAGQMISQRELTDIHGAAVRLPNHEHLTHLQFRRFSGCPICNLHLRSFAQRHDELVDADIAEVVLFHSDAETMREYQGALPFSAVADPDRTLYDEFGVGHMTVRAMLSSRTLRASVRGLASERNLRAARGADEDHLGLPADFLIGPTGRILATKYGKYPDDHWSVDEVLRLAGARTRPPSDGD